MNQYFYTVIYITHKNVTKGIKKQGRISTSSVTLLIITKKKCNIVHHWHPAQNTNNDNLFICSLRS